MAVCGLTERRWCIAYISKGTDQSSNELHTSSKLCGNGINFFSSFLIVIRLITCQSSKRGCNQVVLLFTVSWNILLNIWNWWLLKEERSRLAFELVWWCISICCDFLSYRENQNVCLAHFLRSTSIFRSAISEFLFLLVIICNTNTKGALQTEADIPFQENPHFCQASTWPSRTFFISENKYDSAVNSSVLKEMCQHCELSLAAEKFSSSWGML